MNKPYRILLTLCLSIIIMVPMYGQTYNYAEVLQKSMFFYECQESGPLGTGNRVTWRGNAAMNDGSDVSKDLTGGWFDAGDHVKFNFPMAFSATALAWGGIDFAEGYTASGQMKYLKRNLRYVNDYFIKCHTAPNELYGQVGNGGTDHAFWGSAEIMQMARPAYKIDASKPGSELAAETAAAMAAASIIFKTDDPTYSATLLTHAKQLYSFADNYRGVYSESITDAAGYYRSYSGYKDELVWAAIWLYRATNDQAYLTKAETYYDNLSTEPQSTEKSYKWGIAWDDKSYGCYVLLAKLTGKEKYKTDAERHLDYWSDGYNGSRIKYTPGGLAFCDVWGSLRYAINTSFLALYYSDVATTTAKGTKYYNFAKSQMAYALGNNPQKRSFVCGYGVNPPVQPHHRTAHGGWSNNQIGPPTESRHILYGALVGGPGSDDSYTDERSNYTNNEVACDYNALFSGVLAKFVKDLGGTPLANFPVAETPTNEYFNEAKFNAIGTTYSEYAVWTNNHTAWPARFGSEYKFRIFINISEGVKAGYKASDYVVSSNNAGVVTYTNLLPYDEANNIYYTEVTFLPSIKIWPGGQGECRKEAQMRIRLPYEAPASAWDPTNDWSAQNVNSELKQIENIPLYVDGVLVFGKEPKPVVVVPVTGVSLSDTTASVNAGSTITLTATVKPSDATNKSVSWSSSNTAVATVSSAGVVTGVKEGNATITVKTQDGSKTASCLITVTNIPVSVTGVTLTPSTASVNIGGTAQLTATVVPSNASNKKVSWSSSNLNIATVSSDGLVSGIAAGSATITVITDDGKFEADCEVLVKEGTSCTFGTPLSAALASVHGSYTKAYVLGTGGPNMSNISNFTINWDLAMNGLWQLSFNTSNGNPGWWIDLRTVASWKFNQAQPEITFSKTGISGLDGSYWVALDGNNFVMVSKTGGFAIYFSNSATAPVCSSSLKSMLMSENEVVNLNADMAVYPNPTFDGFITLKLKNEKSSDIMITIYNQLGQIVEKRVLGRFDVGEYEINLQTNLSAGIYILQVNTGGSIRNLKIEKK
jgi:hypothetical protein